MRKVLGWSIGLLLAVAVGIFGLQVLASETGEVVVLHTTADGAESTTRLWVVELDGSLWLRSGGGDSGWYARLAAEPRIQLERHGETRSYIAEPESSRRDEINALMAEKYGWRDRVIGVMVGGRDTAVPVRLRPAD
jgi:hypothetical protein